MTLDQWTAQVKSELIGAGFHTTGEYYGFPFVREPLSFADKKRLIEIHLTLATDRRIYAEGMLFVPAGSPHE